MNGRDRDGTGKLQIIDFKDILNEYMKIPKDIISFFIK